MSKNWSKIVLVSVVVLMVAASMSFASTARVRSLVNTGDYMSDDSNAYRWYSVLPMYANQVNAELGWFNGYGSLADTRALSLNYACGEEGKWGTYRVSLNEHTLDGPGLWATNSFMQMLTPGMADHLGVGTNATTPINKWDVAGGWEIDDNFALGVSFTRSSWDYESTNPDTTADYSFTTIGAGGTWTNNDGFAADVSFTWGIAGGEASLGATDPYTAEWDSKTAFEIAGRAFWDWKDYVTVVPVVSFQNAEYSVTDNQDPTLIPDWNGDKFQNFMLGVGLNIDVNSANMLIFAAEFNRMKWEYANTGDPAAFDFDAEETIQSLPTLRLALETAVNSWMTTRVGAAQHLAKVKTTDDDGDEVDRETGSSDFFADGIDGAFSWTLGLGFNVAEWTIDLELADEAPFSTFYWLTGYTAYEDDNDAPVTRISAIYNF